MTEKTQSATVHSALFFAGVIFAASALVAAACLPVFFWNHAGLGAWLKDWPALFYLGLIAIFMLVFFPLLYLLIWARPRMGLRVRRIMDGEGWGGWVYASGPEKKWPTKRLHLFWQIPLIVLAATAWAVLADAQGWWTLNHNRILHFLLAALVQALMTITLPALLISRAYPAIRTSIKEYAAYTYPGLKQRAADRYPDDAPSADLFPQARHDEAFIHKNLRLNLCWQTPLLLALAALFVHMGWEGTLIAPWHILRKADAVDISVIDPILLCIGALMLPCLLVFFWVRALSGSAGRARQQWENRVFFSAKIWIAASIGCFAVLLPAQFWFMPHLGYRQCNRLEFLNASTAPAPLPVRWVRAEKTCPIPSAPRAAAPGKR